MTSFLQVRETKQQINYNSRVCKIFKKESDPEQEAYENKQTTDHRLRSKKKQSNRSKRVELVYFTHSELKMKKLFCLVSLDIEKCQVVFKKESDVAGFKSTGTSIKCELNVYESVP